MEGNESTSLENLFNGPADPVDPAPPADIAPAPVDQPAPTGETPTAPPAEEQEDPRITAFKTKAIDEGKKRQALEREHQEVVRQNAEMRQYMQRLQAQQQQPQQQPKPQSIQPQQFETYEAYLEALADAKATAKAQEIFDSNMQRAMQMQQQATVQQQTAADLADMISAGKEKYPDFEQVVANQNTPITDTMMNAMMVLDGGHDVGYYLGQNPAEAARIARMPPSSQSREIGKLARQIAVPLQVPAVVVPPVAPPVVAAPDIPKTLTQTRSAGGQYTKAWAGPTPLDQIVRKK